MSNASDAEMAQRLEQASITLQQAFDEVSRKAADNFLQDFRASSRPYALCTLLLQGSSFPGAQFTALSTIKAAIQREGRVLGSVYLTQLKDQLLQSLLMHNTGWNRFVSNQCVYVISILCKWICIDEDEARFKLQQQTKQQIEDRPAYISMANMVAQLMQKGQQAATPAAANGAAAQPPATFYSILALDLAKSLISEFTSGGHRANAGVSISTHVRCHTTFESHVLFNLAQMVLTQSLPTSIAQLSNYVPDSVVSNPNAASLAAASKQPGLVDSLQVLHSLLGFIDAFLSFPFANEKDPDALAIKFALQANPHARSTNSGGEEGTSWTIKPSPKWAPVLIQGQLVEMIVHGYTKLKLLCMSTPDFASSTFPKVTECLHLSRNIIHLLACIHGDILKDPLPPPASVFSAPPVRKTDQPSATSVAFLARLLSGTNTLLERSISSMVQAAGPQAAAALAANDPSVVIPISETQGQELVGFASIVKRLFNPTSFESFYYASELTNSLYSVLQLHHQLTVILLPHTVGTQLHGKKIMETDTTKSECFDLCLENWSSVIASLASFDLPPSMQLQEITPLKRQMQQQILARVRQYSGVSFERYVTARVRSQLSAAHHHKHAGDGEDEDEDDDEEEEGQFMEASYVDEHLRNVAALGKLHTGAALLLIKNELVSILTAWQRSVSAASAGSPHPDLYNIHECFYFLLRLLGHLVGSGGGDDSIDSSEYFISFPEHILAMLRADEQETSGRLPGIEALGSTIETVMNIAVFTNQLLEHKVNGATGSTLRPSTTSNSVGIEVSLKEFCSPLVFESLVWLLQQLVETGYFFIDQGRYESNRTDGPPLPKPFLALLGGGNKPGTQTVFGTMTQPILQTVIHTCTSLLYYYNEEETLMELTMNLLSLMVQHTPIRLQLHSQLMAAEQPSLFRNVFLVNFMRFLTTDPYQFLQANQTAILLNYQSQEKFYNFSPVIIQNLSAILIRCLEFNPEVDCYTNEFLAAESASNGVDRLAASKSSANSPVELLRKHHHLQSLQSMHGLLLPVTTSFFQRISNPQFKAFQNTGLLLKYLVNYLAFYTGVVRELFRDNFDFLFHWMSCTESMMTIPVNAANIDALVSQLSSAAQQKDVQLLRNHNAASSASTSMGQNLLQTFIELVKQYNSDAIVANTSEAGGVLELFCSVLNFFVSFTESFVALMSATQRYRYMQSSLELVNTFINLMEKRTSKSALALRAAAQRAANASSPDQDKQQRRNEALAADLSLLESAEWDILTLLLQLLEKIGSHENVDLTAESTDFASDAVLNGLVLIIPRLSGNMLAQPKISRLFFSLLAALVRDSPNKLASVLNESQRQQVLQVLSFVFDSEPSMTDSTALGLSGLTSQRAPLASSQSVQLHNELLSQSCAATQAIAQYHLYWVSGKAAKERREAEEAAALASKSAVNRGLRLPPPPPPSPFASACQLFLRSLLRLCLFAHLEPTLLDPISDALLPLILSSPEGFVAAGTDILNQWKKKKSAELSRMAAEVATPHLAQLEQINAALEAGFQKLLPTQEGDAMSGTAANSYMSSKTMVVERSKRIKFRAELKLFVLTVRPLISSSEHATG